MLDLDSNFKSATLKAELRVSLIAPHDSIMDKFRETFRYINTDTYSELDHGEHHRSWQA